jgi:hypothetical protein
MYLERLLLAYDSNVSRTLKHLNHQDDYIPITQVALGALRIHTNWFYD